MTIPAPRGVWVTYYKDPETGDPVIESVWAEEIDALREANRECGTKAALLPYATNVTEELS